MSPTWITDIQHFLDPNGEIGELTPPTLHRALFWTEIIKVVTKTKNNNKPFDTSIRCIRRLKNKRCDGTIWAELFGETIRWVCDKCDNNGSLTGWQGTQWDQTKPAKTTKQQKLYSPEEFIEYFDDKEEKQGALRDDLLQLQVEYIKHLQKALSPYTAQLYGSVIPIFAHYLFLETNVQSIEEITKRMVGREFIRHWKNKTIGAEQNEQDIKTALLEFFWFLKKEKGITNDRIINVLCAR
ncbi:hypothetical protein JW935_16550 [candidate division KSB1 bacterium]|nr:hypothetical protein [candidate division KSB1 bacterium]